MRSTVAARAPGVEPVDQKGQSTLESLARAARQIALYGPEHPIAARALQDACRDIAAETSKREITIGVEEDCLLWDGKRVSGGSVHLRQLHGALRERLVASLQFTPRSEAADLTRLLMILAEDAKLLVSSGGVMRAYGLEGPAGILIEDIDFTRELRECEAAWVEICEEVDPEAVEPLRQILESCLHIVRSASEDRTMDQMREVLSEDPAEPSDTDTPVGVLASTIAALVQSAGEIAIHTGSAHRQAWESSILRQFDALGPRWTSHIFRAPATVAPGSPDILSLLARQMNTARCISLILDYPGGIVTERSEGLSLALRRILSDPDKALDIERELHHRAVARGISEEVYRNVVGMLMPKLAKMARADGVWRLLDGGEESLRTEDPALEVADLVETTSGSSLRRSRAFMLLELLDEEMNASQYGSVVKVMLETAGECLRVGDSELLIGLLARLQQEAEEVSGRSSGRRAIAASALTRSGTRIIVSTLVRELGRSPAEQRASLMGLLGSLGDEGMAALLKLARRTHDVDSAEALRVLVRQDRPAFPHLRQLLSDLPLGDLPSALRALIGAGDPTARAQLSALVSRPEPEARLALIRALDEARCGAGADPVIRLLADPEPAVRMAAADVLGRLRVTDAVPALCYVLGRESDFGHGARVKAAAARALGEIRSPEALPSLCELLFSGGVLSAFAGKHPKIAAAEAVGKIGTVEARQAVEEWRRCRHETVREACRRALREMRAGPSLGTVTRGGDGS